jgi:Alanyl-tRNA synthetase
MKILNDEIKNVDKKLSGEVAFKLYDKYGISSRL